MCSTVNSEEFSRAPRPDKRFPRKFGKISYIMGNKIRKIKTIKKYLKANWFRLFFDIHSPKQSFHYHIYEVLLNNRDKGR